MTLKEKLSVFLCAAVVLATLAPLFFMRWGVLDLKKQRAELSLLQAENEALRKQSAAYAREIRLIRSDPAYLDYVARHELGMVAEDEVVIKFHDGDDGT